MILKNKPVVITASITAALILAGLFIVAFFFTNPQAQVGGTAIGFKTQGDIEKTLQETLENTPVSLDDNGTITETTYGKLGVTLKNAPEVAEEIFNQNKLWKIANWGQPSNITSMQFNIDTEKLNKYVADTIPSYSPIVNATVQYENGAYNVKPGANGTTITENELTKASQQFLNKKTSIKVETVEPETNDTEAQQFADKLNNLTQNFAIQAGNEQVKPTINGQLFTWETPFTETTPFVLNEEIVKDIATQTPSLINREGIANENIVDSQGNILFTTHVGQSKRTLNDSVEQLTVKIEKGLQESNPIITANVTESQPQDVNTFRKIEVNLTEQKTYLYENNQIVKTYTISSGKAGSPTHEGEFRVNAFVRQQNMGCTATSTYCTRDVPWVVYFNGDEAFHGTYWHNNFGTPMSHGCVNMRINEAEELYRWAYEGMEVSVHK